MAGNANSGNGIRFDLSADDLRRKFEAFKSEYQAGDRGMVTWYTYCDYLGMSVDDVSECYLRGKAGERTAKGRNTYTSRANLLEIQYTAVLGLMYATARNAAAAEKLARTDLLRGESTAGGGGMQVVLWVKTDDPRGAGAAG